MSINDPNTSPIDRSILSPELRTQATNDLGQVTDKAKQDLDAVTQRAAEDVREIGHQAKAKVGEATDKAKSFAADQKDLAAGQLNGVAAAITKVADELEGSDQQTVARYARDLAAGLSNMGKTIEDKDVDELMGLAQDFGRQQPVAFLGAAALAGFVASRFALASAHRRQSKPTSPANTGSTTAGASPTYESDAASQTRTGGL
ncbi:MAG: nutrient deprivation-induced protein [Devosia sp.]